MKEYSIKIGLMVMVLLFLVNPIAVKAMSMTGLTNAPQTPELVVFDNAKLNESHLQPADIKDNARYSTVRVVTAYSSTPDQTDSTPFTTANGMTVNENLVAANWLKFGTRVRIPALFGDKVFVVADRMNTRFNDRLDVWMPSRQEAMNIGLRRVAVEVF
jgi:3D (Asp-Asp-Asp) domain-containing protein